MLVLSPKEGARARNRTVGRLDYEHEHHFIEHEHGQETRNVGNDKSLGCVVLACPEPPDASAFGPHPCIERSRFERR